MRVTSTRITRTVLAGLAAAALCIGIVPVSMAVDQEKASFVVSASNNLGFRLLAELRKQGKAENVVISPISISTALAMTYNGSRGTTQREMARVLGFNGITMAQVNEQYQRYLKLTAKYGDSLQIANSLWLQTGYPFDPTFSQQVQQSFLAEAKELDFHQAAASEAVNQWVNDKTHGKITKLVDQFPKATIMTLLNAVYFKDKWVLPFDPKASQDLPFYLSSGKQRKTKFMIQSARLRYLQTPQLQAVELPYTSGASMWVFLPHKASDLNKLSKAIDAKQLSSWIQGAQSRQGTIYLPRFELSYEADLNQTLKALGMKAAFQAKRADFSGMVQKGVDSPFIGLVKHKTYIKTDEEGTEAAAVTGVAVFTTAYKPEQPFEMRVDRPFFFVIQDNSSRAILFMGTIQNPT